MQTHATQRGRQCGNVKPKTGSLMRKKVFFLIFCHYSLEILFVTFNEILAIYFFFSMLLAAALICSNSQKMCSRFAIPKARSWLHCSGRQWVSAQPPANVPTNNIDLLYWATILLQVQRLSFFLCVCSKNFCYNSCTFIILAIFVATYQLSSSCIEIQFDILFFCHICSNGLSFSAKLNF